MPYIVFKSSKERKRYWTGKDGISLITDWRRHGMTDAQIAEEKIGVTRQTLARWRQGSEELDQALTITEDYVDGLVEGSLLQRALGYDYFEDVYAVEDGREVLVKRVKRHVPADMKAVAMWLYNRRGCEWRGVQQPLPPDGSGIADIKNVLVQIEEASHGSAPVAEAG